MQLMVIILKKTDCLDPLLTKFAEIGVTGATILDSTGMASELAAHHDDDIYFLGALRAMMNPEREMSKTILCVVDDEQISVMKSIVNHVVGDLTQPNTGILFTMPITNIYGGCFSK